MVRDLLRHASPMIFRFVTLALACVACNQAELTIVPDAGVEDACVAHAVVFCDASPSGCVGGGSDPFVSALPSDASFAIGCTANVIGTDRDPVSGVCKLAAGCTCNGDDAGDGSATWSCAP